MTDDVQLGLLLAEAGRDRGVDVAQGLGPTSPTASTATTASRDGSILPGTVVHGERLDPLAVEVEGGRRAMATATTSGP